MQRLDGRLVLSPTDLTSHQECRHLTRLDLGVAAGEWVAPSDGATPETQFVFDRGMAHEEKYLASLRAAGKTIAEIDTAFDASGRRAAEAQTVEAMRRGVDVVYQGTFFDGAWGGQADFLLRVETPSLLGAWSYEIADTKLARKLKVAALLQMATYAERLTVLQGVEPARIHVVTGDGGSRPWRLVDVAAYARRARARLESFVDAPPETGPSPIGHCEQCRWAERCNAELREADDLGLVAGMRGDHRDALRAVGISTMAALASASPERLKSSGIGADARTRLQQQAAEQLRERTTGESSRTLLDPVDGLGLLRLPPPSAGDLYLDFEGDPWFEDGAGIEYLAGIGDRSGGFTPLWAHDRPAEKQLVADLIDRIVRAAQADPAMHVYHYAPYEVTALKKLTGGYGVREAELDQLLREERFVDLYPVVRQSMRISKESYSIKQVEAFYGRSHEGAVASALGSVLEYEAWLEDGDQARLDGIEAYNKDDVDSTRELHEWLEQQRAVLEALHGPLPRPVVSVVAPDARMTEAQAAEQELTDRLHAAGHGLLGDLVGWHRREDRPAWWEVYRLQDLDAEELERDGTALGGPAFVRYLGPEKRSHLYEYSFPAQDTKVTTGEALDVDTAKKVGEVFQFDAAGGRLVLKTTATEPPRPRGLGPGGPLNTKGLREAIQATGEDVLAGRDCLGQALVERRVPAGTQLREGETTTAAVVRLGLALDGEVLAIQGPPGSGKTTAAAELIRELLDAGKKVGVTATSHAVIGNLLKAVGRPALQKCEEHQHCGADGVAWSKDNVFVARALADGDARLVGGTAWFWTRADVAEAVDVLVVDEAGQFSLANAVAVARGARSIVLLGDPQQLAQPTQAVHPGGSGASALEHLLDGHATIPADRGVFLDRSYRMHPSLTAFVSDLAYEGRLEAAEGRERVAVLGEGLLAGSGLRVHPVEHVLTAADKSQQEADAVALLWHSVQGSMWRNHLGEEAPIGPADVLVVAPYNAQVSLIKAALPDGARVGTVDKFQGQEAPVVIYSMTSTSADDAPRGVSFLYDLNRLNVAVSRAQALAVVVLSLLLLDAPVRTPEQLRRVNALCRLVLSATVV
ncbi:TM0106 family RecB-like putative nuclease [Blastococcus sp. VKM Ac-2987]|uniref:TM0106 family RecB-like putative nuclease n=1 Tax=Blastococcus sp. VKM Ac-2987 TaxID=3004141 RepID=UPI0022AB8D17|nr:TM0106 family RecB-like putative nuclease [Blastococcus sp. VKM Ac-2987]MCZ2859980.1 TM0106 family RecB-like putative nuclease [Blastococcus sp. VKM Ac-2987]